MRGPNINPWAVAIIAVLVLGSIAVGWLWVGVLGAETKRDSFCPNGYVCTWGLPSYQGKSRNYGASYASGDDFPAPGVSAKNRFGDRSVRFWLGYGVPRQCLRPGGSAVAFTSDPLAYYKIDISPRGKGCGEAWK